MATYSRFLLLAGLEMVSERESVLERHVNELRQGASDRLIRFYEPTIRLKPILRVKYESLHYKFRGSLQTFGRCNQLSSPQEKKTDALIRHKITRNHRLILIDVTGPGASCIFSGQHENQITCSRLVKPSLSLFGVTVAGSQPSFRR